MKSSRCGAVQIDEVEDGGVLQAGTLQLRVGAHVRSHEGRGGDPEEILGELLLVHELRTGHAHQLDADAHEADVVDVRGDVRARDPRSAPRRDRFAARQRCRAGTAAARLVVNDELGAHDAVRLGVAAALEAARLPQPAHLLRGTCAMMESTNSSSPGSSRSSASARPSSRALAVDQSGVPGGRWDRAASRRTPASPRVEATLEVAASLSDRFGQQVEERRAGVGGRHRAAGV